MLYTKASPCINHSCSSAKLRDTLVYKRWMKDNCFFLLYLNKNAAAEAPERDSLQVVSIPEPPQRIPLQRWLSQAATWEHIKTGFGAFLKELSM